MRAKQRKLAVIGGAAVVVVGAAIATALLTDMLGPIGGAGSMGAAMPAVTMDRPEAAWASGGGTASAWGSLEDRVEVRLHVRNPATLARAEQFRLYFSRDEEFAPETDCLVDDQSVEMEPGATVSVVFSRTALLVDCLDAGPWNAAVLAVASNVWTPVDGMLEVERGRAQFSVTGLAPEAGYRGSLNLEFAIYRESGPQGLQGLYEHPVDVWMNRDDRTCLIEAEALTVPRDPVARPAGGWVSQPMEMMVDLRRARTVVSLEGRYGPFSERSPEAPPRDCEDCPKPEIAGPCTIDEGQWSVVVGPAASSYVTVGDVYVHASPVTLDPTPVTVTVPAGQVTTIERAAYNPGRLGITWSGGPLDSNDGTWLVGMQDQQLDPRASADVQVTVSAVGLEPGFYSGTYVFRAGDWYGTEIRVPVELTVERAHADVTSTQGGGPTEATQDFSLGNYPNPFTGRTTVQVSLHEDGPVRIAVYDMAGREVRVLIDGRLPAGLHEVPFDATGLPSGTYLYRLVSSHGTLTETMTIVR